MNVDGIVERLSEIRSEMETLHEADELTEEQETRFSELRDEAAQLNETRERLVARNEELRKLEDAMNDERNKFTVERAVPVVDKSRDPFDYTGRESRSELRSRAIDAVEQATAVDDAAKSEAVRKLERISDPQGKIPQLILATSSDLYRSAWAKAMAGRENTFTADEANAVARAEEMRTALGLTQSGYAVPAVVDPSVVLTSDGSTNPVRQVARVESITANSWKPITSGGITASWDGELAEVSDDTPTLAQPEITAYKAQAFAQGSVEMVSDWAAVGAELGREFADAKDQLEAAAFISGSGSDQPIGITTALDGTASEQAPATAETFAIADVYSTVKGVPPRFRGAGSRVAILAALGTINQIRQFATANNYHAFLTDLGGGQPAQLLGYPLYEASTMDDADDINAAATADNFIMVAGDWSKYVIVDRIGLSVEFVPHLFNTSTNLPDGRRGWYAHWRVGADSIADGAFNMLSIPTTA